MRKFNEYLKEQDALGLPGEEGQPEMPVGQSLPGEEKEEPAEFDLTTMPQAMGSRVPQGMYKVRLKQLIGLEPLKSGQIGMKRFILNSVMRWLQINDISDLARTERSVERSIRRDWE